MALSIKNRAAAFLRDELKLELSQEKTLITHAKDGCAKFLNFHLSVGSAIKRRKVKAEGQRAALKRVTGWMPRVDAPVQGIVARLQQGGYCYTKHGRAFFPCSKKSFVALEDHEIVMRFNAIWRGIYNYYCVCNNAYKLNRVMYILQYLCLMTLGHKHRRSVRKTIRKFGVFPAIPYWGADGEAKAVKFWRPDHWRRFIAVSRSPDDLEIVMAKAYRLTRTHLCRPCVACGERRNVEMHHVRALRKGNRDMTCGFNRIMSAINRKQVPLCRTCHQAVHAGRYDGKGLSDLAYVPR